MTAVRPSCVGVVRTDYARRKEATLRTSRIQPGALLPVVLIAAEMFPVVGFWDRLLQGNYLQSAPKNRLQNSTTVVGSSLGAGVGWVWMRLDPADSWTLNRYGVDENGSLFDADGDGMPD